MVIRQDHEIQVSLKRYLLACDWQESTKEYEATLEAPHFGNPPDFSGDL